MPALPRPGSVRTGHCAKGEHVEMKRWGSIGVSLLLLGIVGCSSPGHDMTKSAGADDKRATLYSSLGNYSYRVTTANSEAQRWFDQGLRLVYAFNHYEAQKAFREAARIDPGCAMCYWGIAITEGSNYNSPTDADREKTALSAAQEAQRRAAGASPVERALIQALVWRHSPDPTAKREDLDRAYADAMRKVAQQFPKDAEVGTFF